MSQLETIARDINDLKALLNRLPDTRSTDNLLLQEMRQKLQNQESELVLMTAIIFFTVLFLALWCVRDFFISMASVRKFRVKRPGRFRYFSDPGPVMSS